MRASTSKSASSSSSCVTPEVIGRKSASSAPGSSAASSRIAYASKSSGCGHLGARIVARVSASTACERVARSCLSEVMISSRPSGRIVCFASAAAPAGQIARFARHSIARGLSRGAPSLTCSSSIGTHP